MNERQRQIRDDLSDLITGDVLVDSFSRAHFSTDASILEVAPLAIVAPKTTEELSAIAQYALANDLHLHPRGAGTGLAGESLGTDLIVDTSRYLNKILNTSRRTVRVQPGVRLETLQRHLAKFGRMFAPDPVSGDRCTVGGMLATDASGPHSLRYGTTRDHVLGLRIVLADGEIAEVGREPIAQPEDSESPANSTRIRSIVNEVIRTSKEHATDIAREQPSTFPKLGGYGLRGVVTEQHVDLPRLLVGSEGTLAFFAEAELATLPIPPHRGIMLAAFTSLHAAAEAVIESLEYQPSACELIDRRLLSVVRDTHPLYRRWLPENAEAILLIEHQDTTLESVQQRLQLLAHRFVRRKRLTSNTIEVTREPELSLCWNLRNGASPRLLRGTRTQQPIPFVENTAVEPAKLPEFIKRVQNIMKRHGVTASFAAHAGVGTLHTRPMLDLYRADHRAKMATISDEMFQAVLDFGGTNVAEHGAGLLRSGYLPRQFPRLYPAFCRIKAAFDPQNTLNPGKIASVATGFPTHALRSEAEREESESVSKIPLLRWPDLPVLDSSQRCNGCGSCRTGITATRMCPSFKVHETEESSPRAKANLMRHLLTGKLDPHLVGTDEFRKVADYCINCKMCKVECPSAVDISRLMLEAKAAHLAEEGISRTDWFFSNLDGWARFCSQNALVANHVLKSRTFRWFSERFWGLSRYRQIPRFHHRNFFRRAARNGWTRKIKSSRRRRVALLTDTFINYNDPHLGECAVRVLEHLGCRVYVPPQQAGSGMAPLQHGDIEAARACLEWNIKVFADLAREGYDIVTPEPTAALILRDDARGIVQDPDLELIIGRTFEFTEYLNILRKAGEMKQPLSPIPVTVGYHEPCHQRALGASGTALEVLSQIPEMRVTHLDLGCTGMAGTYGMRYDGFGLSMKAGSALIDRLSGRDLHYGATQCAACRMQMEQGAAKRTVHPAKWLAVSYGLVGRPDRIFRPTEKGLVTS